MRVDRSLPFSLFLKLIFHIIMAVQSFFFLFCFCFLFFPSWNLFLLGDRKVCDPSQGSLWLHHLAQTGPSPLLCSSIPAPTPTPNLLVLCANAYAGEQEPGALWGSYLVGKTDGNYRQWETKQEQRVHLSQQGAGPGEGLIPSTKSLLFCPG